MLDSTAAALEHGAPQIHPEYPGNTLSSIRIRKSNPAEGFACAILIQNNEYHIRAQEHPYLEPEAGFAYPDEQGCITVLCAGQNPLNDQRQIAEALGIPIENIRVKYGHVGRALGTTPHLVAQALMDLAAWELGRAVSAR